MKVILTNADILKGVPGNADFCPIAWAMCRIPDVTNPTVGDKTVSFLWKDSQSRVFELPLKAIRFIEDFDSGALVKPISFTLKEGWVW